MVAASIREITCKNGSSFRSAVTGTLVGRRRGLKAQGKAPSVGARTRRAGAVRTTDASAARPRRRAVAVREQRTRFLLALRELDSAWVEAFHATGLSDVYFSRLFTELWLRGGDAVPKTDAYGYVKGVGVQTAMKYVKRAIDEGYLEEVDNPADGRSRLIRMSAHLTESFERLIDRSVTAFAEAFAPPP
jgi:hypothetical protein